MLTVYLDASGTDPKDHYLVLAGFVADTDKWAAFEGEWAALLSSPLYAPHLPEKNGRRYAHAKRLAQWPAPLRESFYLQTNYLLKRAALFGVGVGISHEDHKAAFQNYPHTVKDSKYGLVFRLTMSASCKIINAHHKGEALAFVLEYGDKNQGGALKIFSETKARPVIDAHKRFNLETLATQFKEKWGALQAADMHSYALLKHFQSPRGRYSQPGKYSGDIDLLLRGIPIVHNRIKRADMGRLKNAMEWEVMKPKLWGAAKYGTSPVAPKKKQRR